MHSLASLQRQTCAFLVCREKQFHACRLEFFAQKKLLSGKFWVSVPLAGVEHFFELTSSHAKAVLSSELASLAHKLDVLVPDRKHLGKKAQRM